MINLEGNPIRAMLPGTFDPPTNGHLNLIERSARLFGHLDIVVADNTSKKCLFTGEERMAMLRDILEPFPNVRVVSWNGLVVDYARKEGINVMIRGVRALVDFGYEFELSAIKEMAAFGADISTMVPKSVAEKLRSRVKLLT